MLYYDGANWVRLAGGTDGDVLTATGAGSVPAYETPAAGGGIVNNIQTFTSSGTWTKPAGISSVWVKVWGGGGSGGRGGTGSGGGGGGGGYSEGIISVTGNVSLTVGLGGITSTTVSGGTTSFPGTTTIQATGGTGGAHGSSGGAGGAGGVGSNGGVNLTGYQGGNTGGAGGDPPMNGMGSSTHQRAGKYGGGGKGSSITSADGGAGGAGLVIVMY